MRLTTALKLGECLNPQASKMEIFAAVKDALKNWKMNKINAWWINKNFLK